MCDQLACPAWTATTLGALIAVLVALVSTNIAWWLTWKTEREAHNTTVSAAEIDKQQRAVDITKLLHNQQLLQHSVHRWLTAYRAIARERSASGKPISGIVVGEAATNVMLHNAKTVELPRLPAVAGEPPPLDLARTIDLTLDDVESD